MAQREVVVVSGVRTAIGGYGGSLKDVAPTKLGAISVKEAVSRAKIDNRKRDHKQTPRRKFMQQMWKIEIKRLRTMNGFAEASEELAHHHLVVKVRHEHATGDDPGYENA